jgi:SMC interacting uncharacterized protein involved in chromosome segregation
MLHNTMDSEEKKIYKELKRLYKKKQKLLFLIKEEKENEVLLDYVEQEIEDLEGLLYYLGSRPCTDCSCFHLKHECVLFSQQE